MAVSYNKLWKLLVDKKMSKPDLRKKAEIAPNTMTKLRRDEEVSLTILSKICRSLLNMKDKSNYEITENDIELEKLCADSVELINYARNMVVNHVNIVQIMTYYSLGRWIVETQQMGEKRAKYGSKVIKTLSEKLLKEFGKGFSEDTLKNSRKFYLAYKERISETVFSFFEKEPPFIVS